MKKTVKKKILTAMMILGILFGMLPAGNMQAGQAAVKETNTLRSVYDIKQARKPRANYKSGAHTKTIYVKLTSPTPNATIYYTLDESKPTEDAYIYYNPIKISKTTVIRAVAVADGYEDSEESVFEYNYQLKTPRVSRKSCKFENNFSVRLSCASKGAKIYYTTNGKTPTVKSKRYKGGRITIKKTTTLKVIAIKGQAKSRVVTRKYVKKKKIPAYLKAYQRKLRMGEELFKDYEDRTGVTLRDYRFCLVDVNKDGIKELIVEANDSSGWSYLSLIYTYYKGKVRELVYTQNPAYLRIYLKTDIICEDVREEWTDWHKYYYKIKNGKLKMVAAVHNYDYDFAEGGEYEMLANPDAASYDEMKWVSISKKKLESIRKKYEGKTNEPESQNMHPLTSENIKKYCQ